MGGVCPGWAGASPSQNRWVWVGGRDARPTAGGYETRQAVEGDQRVDRGESPIVRPTYHMNRFTQSRRPIKASLQFEFPQLSF